MSGSTFSSAHGMLSGEAAETESTSCWSLWSTRASFSTAGTRLSRGSFSMASRTLSSSAQLTKTSEVSSSARSGDQVMKNSSSLPSAASATASDWTMPRDSRNLGRLSTAV